MKNILIPVDGSDYGEKAIEKGKEIAKAFGSNIVLLNVVHATPRIYAIGYNMAPIDNINQIYEESRSMSQEILKSSKAAFGDLSDKVSVISLEGDPASEIIHYVNSNDFDLIIMGSHGLGAIMNRLLVGSVTTKVLHHTNKPVLVVQ